jgi:hypothetical protein
MTVLPKLIVRSGILPAIFCLCLAAQLLAAGNPARAQGAAPPLKAAAVGSGLAGARFQGLFGVDGDPNPEMETFIFKQGTFVSASCAKWGFTPAAYWTRRDAKGIRFLAELKSPEHGTMRYEGVFDGKKMTATAYWKKERWYWTVERMYRFKGSLVGPAK